MTKAFLTESDLFKLEQLLDGWYFGSLQTRGIIETIPSLIATVRHHSPADDDSAGLLECALVAYARWMATLPKEIQDTTNVLGPFGEIAGLANYYLGDQRVFELLTVIRDGKAFGGEQKPVLRVWTDGREFIIAENPEQAEETFQGFFNQSRREYHGEDEERPLTPVESVDVIRIGLPGEFINEAGGARLWPAAALLQWKEYGLLCIATAQQWCDYHGTAMHLCSIPEYPEY